MRRLAVLAVPLLAGCTLLAAPTPPAGEKFVVFFTEWSAAIDDPAAAAIRAAADSAGRQPDATVVVTGFADPQGSAAANIELSRTRAQVVYDQLIRDGVAAGRIRRAAHGEVDFALSAQESRRVEIAVGSP